MHNLNMTSTTQTVARVQYPGHGLFYRWFTFFLALGLIGFVTFVLLPELQRIPTVGEGAQIIIDNNIEAGAFYYTDVEKVPEAETFIRGAGVGLDGRSQ